MRSHGAVDRGYTMVLQSSMERGDIAISYHPFGMPTDTGEVQFRKEVKHTVPPSRAKHKLRIRVVERALQIQQALGYRSTESTPTTQGVFTDLNLQSPPFQHRGCILHEVVINLS